MFLHICIEIEQPYVVKAFGYIFLEINDFVMSLLPFIHFFSTYIWKLHALIIYSIYDIEKSDISQENLYYIICYLKGNNFCTKIIFLKFLLLNMGMTTS